MAQAKLWAVKVILEVLKKKTIFPVWLHIWHLKHNLGATNDILSIYRRSTFCLRFEFFHYLKLGYSFWPCKSPRSSRNKWFLQYDAIYNTWNPSSSMFVLSLRFPSYSIELAKLLCLKCCFSLNLIRNILYCLTTTTIINIIFLQSS